MSVPPKLGNAAAEGRIRDGEHLTLDLYNPYSFKE